MAQPGVNSTDDLRDEPVDQPAQPAADQSPAADGTPNPDAPNGLEQSPRQAFPDEDVPADEDGDRDVPQDAAGNDV